MEISQSYLKEVLSYNPDTGIFTWNCRPDSHFRSGRACNAWNAKFAGLAAGGVQLRNGGRYKRVRISIDNVRWKAHRLAYIYMTGKSPAEVDHKNGDATDNRWSNLSDGSGGKNRYNVGMRSDNTSGFTGVVWIKALGKWAARPWLNGKPKHIGVFSEKLDAARAVRKFYDENGYSETHGQDRLGLNLRERTKTYQIKAGQRPTTLMDAIKKVK
ncbi:MAG: HNH endonuclease [Pseudomonadota bacterium]|nr:HNH endonuclease [Pseudomonadota bacterium]